MITHDAYGTTSLSPAEARAVIERLVGHELEERESSYFGIYSTFSNALREKFSVFDNSTDPELADPGDGTHPEFPGYPVIVEISTFQDPDMIRAWLEPQGFRLLDRVQAQRTPPTG